MRHDDETSAPREPPERRTEADDTKGLERLLRKEAENAEIERRVAERWGRQG
jgi:hypothetical protein